MTRCFIIGHPVAHSRSPMIHGHWLAEHGLAGSYERVDVPPAEVAGFIARLRAGEFVGGNVTVPNKEVVLPLLDEASETARAMGAANTLWMEGGRLRGDNTDAYGVLAHLEGGFVTVATEWVQAHADDRDVRRAHADSSSTGANA